MTFFEQTLRQSCAGRLSETNHWLVAVSGGPDSVALLRGLTELQTDFALQLTVAHFNHRTRGESSDADQQWVEKLCEQLGIPCVTGQFITSTCDSSLAEEQRGTVSEATLRRQRISFLATQAQQLGCGLIAMGHHADDQIETLLHHLLRGTSLRGLSGIPESRELAPGIELFRPLLSVSRSQILDYLEQISQDYRTDDSNSELCYTRNRIRHQLIPLLQTIHPAASQNLLRLSKQARDIQAFHAEQVTQILEACLLSVSSSVVRLKLAPLLEVPEFLVRELFVGLWTQQNWPRRSMGQREWHRLQRFLTETTPEMHLPGPVIVQRRAEMLVLEKK